MIEIEDKVRTALFKLSEYIEAEDYKGYDPYDALNSPFANILTLRNRFLRIFLTQAMRRLPFNLRPLLRIEKGINPKALGLFLSGYVKLFVLFREKETEHRIEWLVEKLLSLQSRGFSGVCWGYNFPWQNRRQLFPIRTPTIVNTCFIGRALVEAYEVTGKQQYLELAKSVCDFILNDLKIVRETPTELCLSYTPFDEERIYNANMLGASFLASVSVHTGDAKLLTSASKMAAFVVNGQNPDGSWVYGKAKTQSWIDIHHTGFVLEALQQYRRLTRDDKLSRVIEKGLTFFLAYFFMEDGRLKPHVDKQYPVDIHSVQAIVTLVKLKPVNEYPELIEKTVSWIVDNMQDDRGFFYYRKGRWINNKLSFMRWSQAWVFHMLTTVLYDMKHEKQVI